MIGYVVYCFFGTYFYFDLLTKTQLPIVLYCRFSACVQYFICLPISLATFNFHLCVKDKLLPALALDYGLRRKSWSVELSSKGVSPRDTELLIEEISMFKEPGLR